MVGVGNARCGVPHEGLAEDLVLRNAGKLLEDVRLVARQFGDGALVISALLGLAPTDRVLVLRDGAVRGELVAERRTEEEIMMLATGAAGATEAG